MKTITLNTYSFNELSEVAKQNAINHFRDINTDFDDWHECILEDIKERLKEIGFYDIDIQYSGFWSQGDGLSFDGKIDIEKFTKDQRLISLFNAGYFGMTIDSVWCGNYVHEKTKEVNFTFDYDCYPNILNAIKGLCNSIEGIRLNECKDAYNRLEQYYCELQKDENVIETIIANEFCFLEDGTQY